MYQSYKCRQAKIQYEMIKEAKQGQKVKKELVKKYQYTKPYKDRDRSKDIGKDKPLKKSNRLKFPQKPQYYILHTVKKLPTTHQYFNIFNRDPQAYRAHRKIEGEELARQADANTKIAPPQRRSMSIENSNNISFNHTTNTPSYPHYTNTDSSLGLVTISSKISKPVSDSPFGGGFSVTSGPKVYKPNQATVPNLYGSSGQMTPILRPENNSAVTSFNLNSENGSNYSQRPSF